MAAPSILEPTYGAAVPTSFIAHGCYFYDNKARADDEIDEQLLAAVREDDEDGDAPETHRAKWADGTGPANAVATASRQIDVKLYRLAAGGDVLLYTHANVSRSECNSTRWRTSFGGTGEPLVVAGQAYKLEVIKRDAVGTPQEFKETAELSPFYVRADAPPQTAAPRCLCAQPAPLERLGRLAVACLDRDADGLRDALAADPTLDSCCGRANFAPFPARYDGFEHYTPAMKHAVCMVFDPMPLGQGVVSLTPAEFSMGQCVALVPVPADAGKVAYAYKFLLLDATQTVVLHNSPQKALD